MQLENYEAIKCKTCWYIDLYFGEVSENWQVLIVKTVDFLLILLSISVSFARNTFHMILS